MQVLLGSNFSPVKASYKIKRKKLASDIENLPKVEKPPVSLQDQNAISLNTKRSPLQSIDEIAKGSLDTVNRSQKEANIPSSQINDRKKIHTSKDQRNSSAGVTKTASFENNTPKISNNQSHHPQNFSTSKPIMPQMIVPHRPEAPRIRASEANSAKENKTESLGTLSKNRELQNFAGTWKKETVNVNIEEAMRNKIKYLPHVQIKEGKYGNHLVPVLPSFLIRDN